MFSDFGLHPRELKYMYEYNVGTSQWTIELRNGLPSNTHLNRMFTSLHISYKNIVTYNTCMKYQQELNK